MTEINYDAFSLESSLSKKTIDKKINIIELEPKIKIPNYYDKVNIKLDNTQYAKKIREIIEPISNGTENLGYSPNIFTALYESILNAYQHGNKYNDKKKIIMASSINPNKLEFIIADAGKTLHEKFFRFILKQREKSDENSNFINWYKFSGEKKPETNNGTGTSFMNAYMDEVKYFHCIDTNGLGIYLKKQKNT